MKEKLLAKFNELRQDPRLQQFRDIRAIGLVAFLVIMLLITWSGVRAIQGNYQLHKQIAQLQQSVRVQKLQNKNLKLQNQYYHSDQYLGLAARQDFGLGRKGETELIVPKKVALKHTVPLASGNPEKHKSQQPFYQRNFQAWINFLLHRQNTSAPKP
jgi:cell division protein FtsB